MHEVDRRHLIEKYHGSFVDTHTSFLCRDGWQPVIERLLDRLRHLGLPAEFRIKEFKGEAGALVVLHNGQVSAKGSAVEAALLEAWKYSSLVCEVCGSGGAICAFCSPKNKRRSDDPSVSPLP